MVSVTQLLNVFESNHGNVDASWVTEAGQASREDVDAAVESLELLSVFPPSQSSDSLLHYFSEAERSALREFCDYAMSPDFAYDLVVSARKHNELIVRDPMGGAAARSSSSLVHGSMIFLRFESDTEAFYVIQHNFAAEAICFLKRRCVVQLNDFLKPRNKLQALVRNILQSPARSSVYFAEPERNVWGGLYYGHQSPFHFFNFHYPGVVMALSNSPTPPPCLYTQDRHVFVDLNKTLSLDSETVVASDPTQLRDHILASRTFIFSVGLRPREWKTPLRMRLIDSPLIEEAEKVFGDEAARLTENSDFVLWAGITTGKRSWIQEASGIVELATALAKRYTSLTLLIDGWTATAACSHPPAGYTADTQRYSEIVSRLPENVACMSIVGSSPLRKIAIARKCDFFVGNHATGSLFVSRIARRPGVTHISNAARSTAIHAHTHPRARLIAESLVKDEVSENEETPFHVSYSIAPEDFVRFALAELERVQDEPKRDEASAMVTLDSMDSTM